MTGSSSSRGSGGRWGRLAAVAGTAGVVAAGVLAPPAAAAPVSPSGAAVWVDYPCEQYLTAWAGKTVRSTWSFHIDAAGRPDRATAASLTAGTSPRTKCETTVGGWGGTGSDGGHLIASTLKGVSKRINLVPMRKKINIGIYKMFENGAKKCLAVKDMKVLNYTSQVTYPDAKTVVPASMTVSMLPKKGGSGTEIKLVIPNEDISVQKETALKKKLNDGLKANSCGTIS
ncbi:DNA/RNA non-specific endonuclease [Streptomyces sp. URMC 127]|uniref:DNA/RNA non-specific endonuclease n=1 Tax=Streptomyces sp. URMC 127 TaxID=3423402 RepID=UPI003F1C1527